MIEAVTFDFWNTLYVEDPSALTRRRQRRCELAGSFFASLGRQFDSQAIGHAIQETARQMDQLNWLQQRNYTHAEVGQLIAAKLAVAISDQQASNLALEISSAGRFSPPQPRQGAAELLDRLAGTVKLALISDTALTFGLHLEEVMAQHGLARYFRRFTWSDQTHVVKPAREPFVQTLGALAVAPDRAVHVGDLERRDVAGAGAAGMRSIRLLVDSDARNTEADAAVTSLAGIEAVLKRWGA